MTAPTEPRVVVDMRMAMHSGIGTYVSNLVPRIARIRPAWRWTLMGDPASLMALDWPDPTRIRVIACRSPIYSIREQIELAVKPPRDADLFWSPHYNVPLVSAGRLIVTVHDVAHLSLTQFFSARAQRIYARTMFNTVRRRAAAILCPSAFTRGEYLRHVGAGRADPSVVYNGVDPEWTRPPTAASPHPRAYFVCVGLFKPHKNVRGLIRAFASIVDSVPHDLIVIGRRVGMRSFDDEAERAAAPLGERVVFAGELPLDQLRNYVAHADALVSPSLYEGFGLTPLEAMAAGCPCLVSNTTALPETCGDAALYCDPRNPDDIAARLSQLLTDPDLRTALRERGRRRAATFTWERCATQTAEAMTAAMAERRLS